MTIDLNPNALGLHFTTLFTLVGGGAAVAWLMLQSSMFRLSGRATYLLALKAVFWAVLGARLLHIIDYAGYYADVPFQMFYLWNGGLSAWGAVLGGTAGALWHAKRAGADLSCLSILFAYAGSATLALGRFGDFLAGERIGTSSSLPWAVTYADSRAVAFGAGAMHPVALYEALLVVAGALSVWQLTMRGLVPNVLVASLASYGLIRLVLGFVTVQRTHLGLDLAQWAAIAVLLASAWSLWRQRAAILSADLRDGELPG